VLDIRRRIAPRSRARLREARVIDNCLLTRIGGCTTARRFVCLQSSDRSTAYAPGEFKGTLIWGSEPARHRAMSVCWRIGPDLALVNNRAPRFRIRLRHLAKRCNSHGSTTSTARDLPQRQRARSACPSARTRKIMRCLPTAPHRHSASARWCARVSPVFRRRMASSRPRLCGIKRQAARHRQILRPDPTACNSARFEKKRQRQYGSAKDGTFTVPIVFR